MNRYWVYVILGGIIEILWAMGLKYADNWLTWVGIALLIYLSFVLLIEATKVLPVATVYAVFTGIGTAGTVIVGMVFLGEAISWSKVFFISLLLSGVLGLKLVTNESDQQEGAA